MGQESQGPDRDRTISRRCAPMHAGCPSVPAGADETEWRQAPVVTGSAAAFRPTPAGGNEAEHRRAGEERRQAEREEERAQGAERRTDR